jgi:hypothetical protein
MKRMQLLYSKLITLLFAVGLSILFGVMSIVSTVDARVVCDKFNLVTKLTDSTLDLLIETDLPENTVVMVSVSRSYLEKGSTGKYSVDYFSEKSNIKKWRSKHQISIESQKWKSKLRALQEKMSGYGAGFDVASISDKITVRMVVPINQHDPKFGKQNSNLTGKAVSGSSFRVVKDEVEIDYPLDSPPLGNSQYQSLNPDNLDIGKKYIVSKQTPLMPSYNPEDPIAALQKMRQIPKGSAFKVLKMAKQKSTPWYKVVAFDQRHLQIGTGWINSTALSGQKLKAYK